MRFFPSRRLNLQSMDPPERVRERLASLVAPTEPWGFRPPEFPFSGKLDGSRFELVCLKWLERAGRAPLVTGEIVPTSTGSEVRASVELRALATIALAAVVGILFPLGLWLALVERAAGRNPSLFMVVVPVIAYASSWFAVFRHASRFRKVAETHLGCRLAGPSGNTASGAEPPNTGWSRPAR